MRAPAAAASAELGENSGPPGISLHRDGHVHVAVTVPTVVIAYHLVGAGLRRRQGDVAGFGRIDVGVDAERALKKSVHPILAHQAQGDGLALLEGELVGRELELLRLDLNDSRWRVGQPTQ